MAAAEARAEASSAEAAQELNEMHQIVESLRDSAAPPSPGLHTFWATVSERLPAAPAAVRAAGCATVACTPCFGATPRG